MEVRLWLVVQGSWDPSGSVSAGWRSPRGLGGKGSNLTAKSVSAAPECRRGKKTRREREAYVVGDFGMQQRPLA